MEKLTYKYPTIMLEVCKTVSEDVRDRYAELYTISPSDVAFPLITSGHDVFMTLFPDHADDFVRLGQQAIDAIINKINDIDKEQTAFKNN